MLFVLRSTIPEYVEKATEKPCLLVPQDLLYIKTIWDYDRNKA